MPVIQFLPFGKEARAKKGESLLQLAQRIGLPLQTACGGKGTCGKCKVIVERSEGSLPPLTEKEAEILGPLAQRGYRLACELRPQSGARVRVPAESQVHRHVILTSQTTHGYRTKIRPSLKIYRAKVPAPQIKGLLADRERLLLSLRENYGLGDLQMDLPLLKELPGIIRNGTEALSVAVRNDMEIVRISQAKEVRPCGIAFDIGTTTVVGYLSNLESGEKISVRSALNPQISFGADVISRISFTQEHPEGLEKLRSEIVECMNRIVSEATQEAGIEPEEVLEATVVGNTAMHHLLVGLDPSHLVMAPYPPVLQAGQDIKARDLGLKINPSGYVHLLPLKAGFVGSDTMACILATGIHKTRTRTLLLDLGTNGEIVFGNRDRLICCSTAAGPAFEGGHIRWGMRAAAGAIERVNVDPATFEVEIQTIDGDPPMGLCGSGIISAVAEMVRKGILMQKGGFSKKIRSPRLRRGEDGAEFVLAWASESGVNSDIVLTEKDVSELIMAKAALFAGASLLVEILGSGPIEKVLLAGACGNYVDPLDAATVDLFPGCHTARMVGVGNAAGHGSCIALLDQKSRREVARIAEWVEYEELAANPRFQDLFVSSMFFTRAFDYGKEF